MTLKMIFLSMLTITILCITLFVAADLIQTEETSLSVSFDQDLMAHWRFNETNQSIIYDHSGNGFHGSILGNPSWGTGKIDDTLEFDGDGDHVTITGNSSGLFSSLSQLGQGSISIWFRVDHIPTDYGIMPIFYYGSASPCTNFFDAANQGLIIEVGHSPIHLGSKRIYFTIWANGCTYPSFCYDSRFPLTEGTWYHFVAVVGPDDNTGYLNGDEMTNRRYNFGTSQYSQFFEDALVDEALWFGKGYWNAQDDASPVYFDGAIDDIRIFSKPLSDQEVEDIYREGTNNLSPQTPEITGPSEGNTGKRYTYIIRSTDPEEDEITYSINWGDGTQTTSIGPAPSGKRQTISHSWTEEGDYEITVRAEDRYEATSQNATFSVTMPKPREYDFFGDLIQSILQMLMTWF